MSPSLLIIPGYRIYPLETGAGVAQYAMIDGLRDLWNITLLIDNDNVVQERLPELEMRWPNVSFISWSDLKHEWESWARGNIGYRIKRKLGLNYNEPLTKQFEVMEEAKELWQNVGFLFHEEPEWRVSSLLHHLKNNPFDIVQTDLPSNLGLAKAIPKSIVKIHVCHELKHKRFEISSEGLEWPAGQREKLFEALRERELRSLSDYDHIVCFSEADKEAITQSSREVSISPFPVLDEDFQSKERLSATRFVFLGPEHHGPNKEGLIWFLNEIWSKSSNTWTLHVIGKWKEATIKQLQSGDVIFEGFVDDLEPFYKDSIMIVPVLSGAGIRTKIIQAMARKVPVLSTPFAAQGLEVQNKKEICFFEDEVEFGEQLQLLNDDQMRRAITESAFSYAKSHFSQDVLVKTRSRILSAQL